MIPVVEQLQDHKNVCSWTPEGKRYRKKKKTLKDIMAKKVYKHDQNYKSTDSKSPVRPKHKKCEENQTKTHYN